MGIFDAIHLTEIFEDMKTCEQNPKWHSEGNVFNHTMLVVKAAVARAPKIENEIDRFVFIMGAILHDCGKPASGRKNGLSKNGFPAVKDHAEVGAPIAYKFLRDLRLDCATAHRIEGLVANHMKMHQLGMMDKKFAIMSILNLPDFDLLCELCRSDSDGCIKTAADDEEMPLDEALASPKIASLIGQPIPAPIVTGDDLIALGFKPSEKFRKALEVAHKDQVNNGKTDKAILIANIKNMLK
jgi:putative nucleotidyltransferase with HDIG domain